MNKKCLFLSLDSGNIVFAVLKILKKKIKSQKGQSLDCIYF